MRDKILKVAMNHTKNKEAATQLTNELCDLLDIGFLPVKSAVESIIENKYKNMYGTNYDENSLKNAKQGGMIITNWLLNNR